MSIQHCEQHSGAKDTHCALQTAKTPAQTALSALCFFFSTDEITTATSTLLKLAKKMDKHQKGNQGLAVITNC